jgi:hypothetical protein
MEEAICQTQANNSPLPAALLNSGVKPGLMPLFKTPEPLCQQAVALLAHYLASTIIKTLKISSNNMKRRSQQLPAIGGEAELVILLCIGEPVDATPAGFNLELAFNNGCRLRLQGDISPAQLTALMQDVNTATKAVA